MLLRMCISMGLQVVPCGATCLCVTVRCSMSLANVNTDSRFFDILVCKCQFLELNGLYHIERKPY